MSQFVWYAPYGESLVDEHLTTYENPFKFSSKELDDVTGLYDHGARNRNPITAVWYGIDELFEKYPENGPYSYCGGNPVRYFDPDGREIEKSSLKIWNNHKKSIIKKIGNLTKQMEKTGNTALQSRVNVLKNVVDNMSIMEKSSQVYSLDPKYEGFDEKRFYFEGDISLDDKGVIVIKYNGKTDQFIHEIIHCIQFEIGELAFVRSTGRTIAQDIFDEIAAYIAENAFSGNYNVNDINTKWILDNYNDVYGKEGSSNTAQEKVDITSTSSTINRAYGTNIPAGGFLKHFKKNFYYQKQYKQNLKEYKNE